MAQVSKTTRTPGVFLGLVIDGLGSHPAAWRSVPQWARAAHGARYYVDQVQLAERAGLDFAILADRHGPAPTDDRAFRGRLDPALLAARLAPATNRIGLIPEFTVTHAEPFHISKAVATIDHASLGRAGWVVGVSTDSAEAALYGRRDAPDSASAWREAADVTQVVQRLWDSWEDDAEIRDLATGRFVDAAKLHYVDFAGDFFSVKGPSITPRPPQGQPPTFVRTGDGNAEAVIGPWADVVVSRIGHPDDHAALDKDIRESVVEAGRPAESVRVLAELDVTLAETDVEALELAEALAGFGGARPPGGQSFVGSAQRLVELITDVAVAADGFVINFSVLPTQLPIFVDRVVPALRDRGLLRPVARTGDLRSTLGLGHPANRYAAADPAATAPPADLADPAHCDRCTAPAGAR